MEKPKHLEFVDSQGPHFGGADEESLWRAFRYMHDEMTDDERAAFEVEMSDRAGLQDAVVEAVALTDIIRFVPPTRFAAVSASPRRKNQGKSQSRQRRWVWMSVATTVLALLGAAWFFSERIVDDQDSTGVALAWVDQLEQGSEGMPIEVEWGWSTAPGDEAEGEAGFDNIYLSAGGNLSESWIFSAVLESDDWDWDPAGTR